MTSFNGRYLCDNVDIICVEEDSVESESKNMQTFVLCNFLDKHDNFLYQKDLYKKIRDEKKIEENQKEENQKEENQKEENQRTEFIESILRYVFD
jgi:tRNA A22 N-methylase